MHTQEQYLASYSSPVTARDDRKLILSVDDDLGVLFSRYKLLAAAGYAVLSACDGVQALGIFSSERVDLVLVDYHLEGMHGGYVAEAIKAHLPEVPVVMVTTAEVPEQYLSICDAHVPKTAGPEHLLHSIRRLLFPAQSPEFDCVTKAS